MRIVLLVIALHVIVTSSGCTKQDGAPTHASQPNRHEDVPARETQIPVAPERRYQGPPVTVEIVNSEGALSPIAAVIKTTAPTGGWTFTIDDTKYNGETIQIYMTLEGPGADELVIQTLEEHKRKVESTQRYSHAEVYVHLARRDIQTLTTDYRLATTSQPQ